MQYLVQWRNAQVLCSSALSQISVIGDGAATWVKPQENIIKVTVDAAIFEGQFGFGIVARDYVGEIVQAGEIRERFYVQVMSFRSRRKLWVSKNC